MKEIKRGLLIGRMQPVHNGHIEVIKETFPGKVGELNAEATKKAYDMG